MNTEMPIADVVALLRLSHKYQVGFLLNLVLSFLDTHFPYELDQHQKKHTPPFLPTWVAQPYDSLLQLIVLAFDLQLVILPNLLISTSINWDKHLDIILAELPNVTPERLKLLTTARVCAEGEAKLKKLYLTRLFRFAFNDEVADVQSCQRPGPSGRSQISPCTAFRHWTLKYLLEESNYRSTTMFHRSAINIWQRMWKQEACDHCGGVWLESMKEEQKKGWDELPGLYGLPSWDVLIQKHKTLTFVEPS